MITDKQLNDFLDNQERIFQDVEKMALDVYAARNGKPLQTDLMDNNYWSMRDFDLLGETVFVNMEFISQSPDSMTIAIPLRYFREGYDWHYDVAMEGPHVA